MTAIEISEPSRHGNRTGILAMIAAAASFTANDTFVKILSARLPVGEIIVMRNTAATLYILLALLVLGGFALPRNPPKRLLGIRMFSECFSTIFFLSGLVRLPIADATALVQFTPLAITAAAAIFLKEQIGWPRWLAAAAGFAGVLLIVRPGSSAFSPAALLILVAVALIVQRDLATRYISGTVPTLTLTLMSAVSVIPAGLLMMPYETWVMPSIGELALCAAAGLFLTGGYALIIIAMRAGDIATVGPFRYSAVLFGLLSGFAIWHEWPDGVQGLGIAILTAAGLYAFHLERLSKLASVKIAA